MSMFGKRGRGFTLIELLTVIAIITILASLALGGISVARKRARIAGTKAELKNLSTGVDQFFDDFGYYPPSHRTPAQLALLVKATPAPTPVPTPSPWNFVDADLDTYADALTPSSDSTSPRAAVYEENGIELLILYLSTTSKNGPYLDTDTAKLVNKDGDSVASNAPIFNAAFSINRPPPDDSIYGTVLYEWEDLFGQPVVYVRFDRYNMYNAGGDFTDTIPNLTLPTDDPDADGLNKIDGKAISSAENNEFRRVTPLDPRTADSYRESMYILYSIGPNGIDNLGYGDDGNGIDDDGNGVVDDEDDITIW